jgi:hypothetical protein
MAKSRRKWTGHVARMSYRWESQKERDHRSVDNIKIDVEKIGWSGVDWIHMEGSYEHGNEPSGYVTCSEILEWLLSRRAQFHGVMLLVF